MSHADMKGKRVYLFGPMSNVGPKGNWNFPAFERAALYVEALGGIAVCPSRIDKTVWDFDGTGELRPGMTYRSVISIDMAIVPTCDMGYGLRGWSKSSGAMPEVGYMQCLGMPIEFEAGAERGLVGYVADPTWEKAYVAELENEVEHLGRKANVFAALCRRDEFLSGPRERAGQTGLAPAVDPLAETRTIPRFPDAGHDSEEE